MRGTFAVVREAGPGWDPARPLREQPAWPEHAAFMDALADEGFVVLGGPLAPDGRTLLIVGAQDEAEIRARFADDPWTPLDVLRIASVEPWEILLGADRITAA
jgi:uncharacterized protein YciI